MEVSPKVGAGPGSASGTAASMTEATSLAPGGSAAVGVQDRAAAFLQGTVPGAQVLAGGVAAPLGFEASGVHAGIKQKRPDLALLYSRAVCSAAAVFTTNRVQAAPVLLTREHLAKSGGRARAVVVNSGNANACTGSRGLADAREMASQTAAALGVAPEEVLVASTGVIGVPLPMEVVVPGIRRAAAQLSREGGAAAARAILTTDTRPKEAALALTLTDGRVVRVGGMAKGSGMIHPNMATMLAFITTDAPVAPHDLAGLLRAAVDDSFNMITVDGDTSTNDMALLLANGQAGGPALAPGTRDFLALQAGVGAVATYLAREIARDGEGARRLIEVQVQGAQDNAQARQAARAIARSNLVKTAVAGADANWGRIVAAAGYSGACLDPERLSVWLGDVQVVRDGIAADYDESDAAGALCEPEVTIRVDLGTGGTGRATAWTCDMTEEYVRINASYRT